MKSKGQNGFTLVEILIVVIILAILAGVVIPQFSSSSDEAKLAVLRSDLKAMRGAVELYYHQHNSVYPGGVTSNYGGHATNAEWFVDQLTLYTDVSGEAVAVKDATHKYGPYLKRGIPVNPFNDLNTVIIDKLVAEVDNAAVDSGSGWKFYTRTGRLIANDGAHGTY
jgi:prepilin-type N-terminal cleavage/methylation domain-containing protein